ncbi:MAG: glycosyltransferase family 4 protein [Candidatus Staskawiczbacteria bacterium]|jgi:glycosyltransferase involved in cell wall biosynthesis
MKICFLASANSVHSYKWVKYFVDKGHKVHWVSFTENTQGQIKGVSFYQIDSPFPFNFIKLRKIVKKIKPDIFHAHYAGVNGFLAALVGFHPFVLTAWGSDVLIAGKHFIKKFFVKYALNKADLITCDANHMQKAMVGMRVPPSKIKIIYFGIDVLKFSPGEKNKDIEEKLGIFGCPVVVSLRSLEPVYNVETFIKAIPLVLSEISETKFIIAGKGSEEEKLKELAKSLGIFNNVRFIGWISQDDLSQYLRVADVYVSTSLSDAGIASSTAEAMACGVCPIITDFGDNKEWVKDGKNGFLMPLKDHHFLVEKIIYLLKNPEEMLKLGYNARKVIEEKNNYYKEMERMEKLYESFKKN